MTADPWHAFDHQGPASDDDQFEDHLDGVESPGPSTDTDDDD